MGRVAPPCRTTSLCGPAGMSSLVEVAAGEADGADQDQQDGGRQRQRPGLPDQAVLQWVAAKQPSRGLAARTGRSALTCWASPSMTKPNTASAAATPSATGRPPVAAPTANATAAKVRASAPQATVAWTIRSAGRARSSPAAGAIATSASAHVAVSAATSPSAPARATVRRPRPIGLASSSSNVPAASSPATIQSPCQRRTPMRLADLPVDQAWDPGLPASAASLVPLQGMAQSPSAT
jgi:hypothetical protein